MSWWRKAPLMLLVLALAGCGFQLRGTFTLPPDLLPVYIEADRESEVADRLREMLRRNGAGLAGDRASASSVIEILGEKRERRVLSVSATTADVDEYELRYTTEWLLRDTGEEQRPLLGLQTLETLRDYTYDRDAVLAKQREEEDLVETMQEDSALRILYRLQAWEPSQTPTPEDVEAEQERRRGD